MLRLHRAFTAAFVGLISVQAVAQMPPGGAVSPAQAGAAASVGKPGEGASANYRVGAGDLLSITVYRAPDLQSQVRISSDGTIPFGTLGAIKVADKTASEIADLLAARLKSGGIFINPSVNVLVAEVRSKTIMVMGAVGHPGEMPLDTPGLTLSAILARAGAEFGTGNSIVTVMQAGGAEGSREQLRMTDLVSGNADRPAKPGEILVVQAAPSVYVSGEVGRPGAFPLQPGMTVGQALALGGGITPRGSRSRVRLTRTVSGQKQQTFENVKFDMLVQADDLIFVKQRVF